MKLLSANSFFMHIRCALLTFRLNNKAHKIKTSFICEHFKVQVAEFRNFPGIPALSGLELEMPAAHKARGASDGGGTVEYLRVPCFSLVTIMKALDVDTVDYFSLDVEGRPFSMRTRSATHKKTFQTHIILFFTKIRKMIQKNKNRFNTYYTFFYKFL